MRLNIFKQAAARASAFSPDLIFTCALAECLLGASLCFKPHVAVQLLKLPSELDTDELHFCLFMFSTKLRTLNITAKTTVQRQDELYLHILGSPA